MTGPSSEQGQAAHQRRDERAQQREAEKEARKANKQQGGDEAQEDPTAQE